MPRGDLGREELLLEIVSGVYSDFGRAPGNDSKCEERPKVM